MILFQLLGQSSSSLQGSPWVSLCHPADAPILEDAIRAFLPEGAPVREWWEITKDGESLLQTTFQVRVRLITASPDEFIPAIVSAFKLMNPHSNVLEYIVAHHQVRPTSFLFLLCYPLPVGNRRFYRNHSLPNGRDSVWESDESSFLIHRSNATSILFFSIPSLPANGRQWMGLGSQLQCT